MNSTASWLPGALAVAAVTAASLIVIALVGGRVFDVDSIIACVVAAYIIGTPLVT
jgi:2-methylcitrate dehydratase PrpD